jgi:hypothetical protein
MMDVGDPETIRIGGSINESTGREDSELARPI